MHCALCSPVTSQLHFCTYPPLNDGRIAILFIYNLIYVQVQPQKRLNFPSYFPPSNKVRSKNLTWRSHRKGFEEGRKLLELFFVCYLYRNTSFHSYNLILLEWSGNQPKAVVSLLQYENPVYYYSGLHLLCYKLLFNGLGDVLQKLQHAVLEPGF